MSNVFSQILWPAAERFKPDFILVSAGYDSHAADPLGQFQCTTNTYGWMSAELVQMASTLCGPGRVLFVLEGEQPIGECFKDFLCNKAEGQAPLVASGYDLRLSGRCHHHAYESNMLQASRLTT
eukprot:scaffold90197_cov18-Tisochrysis_lutea.AAC.1